MTFLNNTVKMCFLFPLDIHMHFVCIMSDDILELAPDKATLKTMVPSFLMVQ